MKKIMKKALSLALALVMVFTLAPVTANAAAGDVTTLQDSVTVELDAYETHQYEYTPTAWGYITFTIEEAEGWYVNIYGGDGQACLDNYSDSTQKEITYNVIPGEVCTVSIMTQNADGSAFAAGSLTYSVTFTEAEAPAAGSELNPIALTSASTNVTVQAGEQLYYTVAPTVANTYTLTVSGSENDAFGLVVPGQRGGTQTISATSGKASYNFDINPAWGMSDFTFSISNTSGADLSLTIAYDVAVGTYNNPVVLSELGDETAPVNGNQYWYQWTATATGTFSITISQEDFDAYAGAQVYMITSGEDSTYPDLPTSNVHSVSVNAGDVLLIQCSAGSATLDFTTAFVPGTTSEGDNNNDNNDDNTPTEGVITPGEGDVNYAQSTAPIVVGDNTLTVSNDYQYTIFVFEPTEEGVYTLTSEDSVMGIVGYFWVTDDLVNAETVCENTIEWECTAVGQAIYLAVMANTNIANITVEREELVVVEIPSENAYPTVSLETYVFDGDVDKLESLMYGINDGEVFLAQDEDGFYHVVPLEECDEETLEYIGEKPLEDYPLALVKLNDSVLSLASAIGYGSVKWVSYNTEGETPVAEYIIYFNDMLTEYISYSATDAKLYPLTDDLAYTMILVGEDQGWYEEDGFVAKEFANDGIEEEFLMFFAMYYLDQDITTLDKEEPVVEKNDMTTIIENNKDKETVISTTTTNATGEEVEVKFTFEANTMKPVDGVEEYSFKVELVEDYNKATADKADIEKDEFVIRINFEYDGQLPATATISIPVGTDYANKTLYYYQILADGTLKYVCDAPVDAAGNAKVTQDHCSDYVLLAEKIVEPIIPGGTGDATNIALWIAVLGLGVVAIAGSVVMRKREF